MTHDDIRAAILASPALQALLPDSSALAAALSMGRTRAGKCLIGKGDVIEAIGLAYGNAALDAVDASPDYRHVRHLLTEGRMDAGSPMFGMALAGLVAAGVLSQPNANTLAALGRVPDPVNEFTVRCAIYADDGGLRV